MRIQRLLPRFAILAVLVLSTSAMSQTTWQFDCDGVNRFNWQGVISDTAGPIDPGTYQIIYCYYTDSIGSTLIGCCTTTVTVEEDPASGSPEKATGNTVGKSNLAYPVPIVNDTASPSFNKEIFTGSMTHTWLELNFDNQIITPRIPIFSVPSAGFARRIIGDLNTSPGRLAVLPANPALYNVRVVLTADSTESSGRIDLVNVNGLPAMSLSESGIKFSDGTILESAPRDAGVAQALEGSISTTIAGTTVLQSAVINPPANGYVLVIGSCQGRMNHTNGTGDVVNFGVTKTNTTYSIDQDKAWTLPSVLPTGLYENVISVQKIFPVTTLDTMFFFVAQNLGSANVVAFDMTLSLVYFPVNYGAVEAKSSESPFDEHNEDNLEKR